jgi:two-component system OmpR family sensor kinase
MATAAVEAAMAIDPGHQVTLESESAAVVLGDEGRLRQALDNLLANCRVHTPVGTTTTVTVIGADGGCRVDVADDGPGMTSEQAAHAFERFYRGDPSRSRDSGGSGLGLAIVASIVEAHGGRATIESALGKGTRVILVLPPA